MKDFLCNESILYLTAPQTARRGSRGRRRKGGGRGGGRGYAFSLFQEKVKRKFGGRVESTDCQRHPRDSTLVPRQTSTREVGEGEEEGGRGK